MMQHNKLEILHLTKRFGEKTLFEDLNLTVEEPAVLWAPSDTLLLDEPFTGMDPETLQKAAALIRERGGGKNVLLATHDRDAIAALGWPVIQLAE